MRVVAVCLTADRQYQTDRAVRAFHRQGYQDKRLMILDTGKEPYRFQHAQSNVMVAQFKRETETLGELRNVANRIACERFQPDYIITWDSDDYHAHDRIEEQMWTASGILPSIPWGLEDVPFFDERTLEAWVYRSEGLAVPGATLIYPAEYWRAHPFPHLNIGEDTAWQAGLTCERYTPLVFAAAIHGGNTCSRIDAGSSQFRREPRLDAWCFKLGAWCL